MAEDIKIACAERGCTEIRLFTVKDQEFYARKGFTPPKRCRTHSAQKRAAHAAREQEQQQETREGWNNDRGVGPVIPGQESDAELLA